MQIYHFSEDAGFNPTAVTFFLYLWISLPSLQSLMWQCLHKYHARQNRLHVGLGLSEGDPFLLDRNKQETKSCLWSAHSGYCRQGFDTIHQERIRTESRCKELSKPYATLNVSSRILAPSLQACWAGVFEMPKLVSAAFPPKGFFGSYDSIRLKPRSTRPWVTWSQPNALGKTLNRSEKKQLSHRKHLD